MNQETKHFYDFGPFRFDPDDHALLRDGKPIPLAPKVTDTLCVLLRNAGHLVDKETLINEVWPDAVVEEGNLNKNIFILRRALGQWDGGREYIETVPRRGYRFGAVVIQKGSGQEQTPHRSESPDLGQKIPQLNPRHWLHASLVTGVLAVLSLALFFFWQLHGRAFEVCSESSLTSTARVGGFMNAAQRLHILLQLWWPCRQARSGKFSTS